jgi:hypothetical protein
MRKNMWVGSAMTGMTVALLGAPVAHADDASFLAAVTSVGFQQRPVNLIEAARSVCYAFWVGDRLRADPTRDNPPDLVENRIARNLLVSPYQAHQFLILSVKEYCPQYSDRLGE